MADTLRTIVGKAAGRLSGLDVPASVVGNSDVTTALMLALLGEEGDELLRAHDWSALVVEGATLTLKAGQELYALPADFARLVGRTTWDRSVRWPLQGPDSPQMARARREAQVPADAFRRSFRQVGAKLRIWPVPTTDGDVIAFDYVSRFWIAGADGTTKGAFTADDDAPLLPDHLFVLGLKWRWLDAQSMASAQAQAIYGNERRLAIVHDAGGGRTVNMGARCDWDGDGFDGVVAGPLVTLPTSGS